MPLSESIASAWRAFSAAPRTRNWEGTLIREDEEDLIPYREGRTDNVGVILGGMVGE